MQQIAGVDVLDDVPIQLTGPGHLFEDAHGVVMAHAGLIGPLLHQGLVHVDAGHQALVLAQLFGTQTEGVAAAVQLFMVQRRPAGDVLHAADAVQQLPGAEGVVGDLPVLRVGQARGLFENVIADEELSDIMQRARDIELVAGLLRIAVILAQALGLVGHALGMLPGKMRFIVRKIGKDRRHVAQKLDGDLGRLRRQKRGKDLHAAVAGDGAQQLIIHRRCEKLHAFRREGGAAFGADPVHQARELFPVHGIEQKVGVGLVRDVDELGTKRGIRRLFAHGAETVRPVMVVEHRPLDQRIEGQAREDALPRPAMGRHVELLRGAAARAQLIAEVLGQGAVMQHRRLREGIDRLTVKPRALGQAMREHRDALDVVSGHIEYPVLHVIRGARNGIQKLGELNDHDHTPFCLYNACIVPRSYIFRNGESARPGRRKIFFADVENRHCLSKKTMV